jgi:O-antigen/teichoic acid export membrane protein
MAQVMADAAEGRASGGRLLSGTLWNAFGRGLPLLLALALTPVLVHQMGIERWGLFTLALALVGVFGVFDLGVGAALTRALAERIGAGQREGAAELAGAAISALTALSAIVAALAFGFVPLLVERLLNVPPALQAEAIAAFRLLCLAAPLVVVNAALWGTLAAHQRFREANLVTMPVAAMYYIGPALVLLAWQSLVGVILALLACRVANTLSYWWLARRDLPGLRPALPRWALVGPLVRMGGWMSASGVLTQALLYADRFLVGALLTLSAVAYYATPLDLVMRMWILPVAVAQALLPAMASAYATHAVATAGLLRRGALLAMAAVLPACLVLVAAGPEILRLWLGAEFAAGGGRVLQILSVGIFFSCAAFAPGALLDAIGRPDVNAKWQLGQALVFLPVSALGLVWLGIDARRQPGRCAAQWMRGRLVFGRAALPESAGRRRASAGAARAAGSAREALLPSGRRQLTVVGLLALAGFAAACIRALAPAERRDARGLMLRRPWRIRAVLRGGSGVSLAINGRFLTQTTTGVQRFAAEVTTALAALAAAGEGPRPRLLAPRGAPERLRRPAGRDRRPRLGPGLGTAGTAGAAGADMLINLGNTAPLRRRGNQLVVIHDAGVFDTPESYTATFRAWYRTMHAALARGGARIVTVSAFSRGRLAERLRLDPARIAVMPEGGEHVTRLAADREVLAKHGLRPLGYALAVGTRRAHKNLDALRGAAALLGGGAWCSPSPAPVNGASSAARRMWGRRRARARPRHGCGAARALRERRSASSSLPLRGLRPAAARGDVVRLPRPRLPRRRGAGGLRGGRALVRGWRRGGGSGALAGRAGCATACGRRARHGRSSTPGPPRRGR